MSARKWTDEQLFWRAFDGRMRAMFWRLAVCPICNADRAMMRALRAKRRAFKRPSGMHAIAPPRWS